MQFKQRMILESEDSNGNIIEKHTVEFVGDTDEIEKIKSTYNIDVDVEITRKLYEELIKEKLKNKK